MGESRAIASRVRRATMSLWTAAEAIRFAPRQEQRPWRRGSQGRRALKVREIVRIIEEDGWYLVRTRGSHRQFKHSVKSGLVTVAGHPNDDLAPGTVNNILKQAGLK